MRIILLCIFVSLFGSCKTIKSEEDFSSSDTTAGFVPGEGLIDLPGGKQGSATTSDGYFTVVSNYALDIDGSSFGGMASYDDEVFILLNRVDPSGISWKDIYSSAIGTNNWTKVCSIVSDYYFLKEGLSVDQNYFYLPKKYSGVRVFLISLVMKRIRSWIILELKIIIFKKYTHICILDERALITWVKMSSLSLILVQVLRKIALSLLRHMA